jgi:hypothetical protein
MKFLRSKEKDLASFLFTTLFNPMNEDLGMCARLAVHLSRAFLKSIETEICL